MSLTFKTKTDTTKKETKMFKLEPFQKLTLALIPCFFMSLVHHRNLAQAQAQAQTELKGLTLEEVKICIEYCKMSESEQKKESAKTINLCKNQCDNGCVKDIQSCFDD